MNVVPCLIIPDSHFPYQSVRAYNLMLEIASFINPKYVYLLGDYADMYYIHQHGPKDPRITHNLMDEVSSVNEGLNQIDKLFPDAKKVYIQGNHEWRLERFIQNKCPELFGFVTWDHLLNLTSRPKWTWCRYWPGQYTPVAGSKLMARHEPLAGSAAASVNKGLCNLIYGHTHKYDIARRVGLTEEFIHHSPGWLGDKNKDAVFGYVKGHFNWNLGFDIVWVDQSTKEFFIDWVSISDDFKSVYQGKLFKG